MFALSKLFWWLAQPSRFFLIVFCLSSFLLLTKHFKLGRILLIATSSLSLLALALPLHIWFAAPLEQRFALPDPMPEQIDGILILGGGVDQLLTEFHQQVSLNGAAERMTEAFALSRQYPTAKIIFSGGTALVNPKTNTKEADTAKAFFQDMGLAETRFQLEPDSRNTFENAVYSKALLQPKEDETWLLVTSAFHMPRSVGIFRQLDWEVIPYPVDYRVGHNLSEYIPVFFSEKLGIIDSASKEWVGLIAYRLLGRTSELFPKP